MNRIKYEIRLLHEAADNGDLPGYDTFDDKDSFYSHNDSANDLEEYFSGENDAIEQNLNNLWQNDSKMKKYIPLIIAAVEKSREQKEHVIVRTELYNYTL